MLGGTSTATGERVLCSVLHPLLEFELAAAYRCAELASTNVVESYRRRRGCSYQWVNYFRDVVPVLVCSFWGVHGSMIATKRVCSLAGIRF